MPTGAPTCSTAAITSEAPTRPSLPIPPAAEVRTQRIRPSSTASASHAMLTWLSRPEKPPKAATSAPEVISEPAAPDWLATAIVPPPLAPA